MKIASYTTFHKDLRTGGLEYALQHSAALGVDAIEVIHAKRGPPPATERSECWRPSVQPRATLGGRQPRKARKLGVIAMIADNLRLKYKLY